MSGVLYPSSYPGLDHPNSQYHRLEEHIEDVAVETESVSESEKREEERIRQMRLITAKEIERLLRGSCTVMVTIKKEDDSTKQGMVDLVGEDKESGVIVPTKDGKVVRIDIVDYEEMVRDNEETSLTRHYENKGVDVARMRDWYKHQDELDYDEEGYTAATLACVKETDEGDVLVIERLPKYEGRMCESEKTMKALAEHAEQGGALATVTGHTDASQKRQAPRCPNSCCKKKKGVIWLVIAFVVVIMVSMCS